MLKCMQYNWTLNSCCATKEHFTLPYAILNTYAYSWLHVVSIPVYPADTAQNVLNTLDLKTLATLPYAILNTYTYSWLHVVSISVYPADTASNSLDMPASAIP